MKEIVIPKTELKVSALCLGGGPHGVDPEESEKVLDYYLASGGNFIDTANIYGQWKPGGGVSVSERFLGKYIKSRKCRNRIVLDTKGAAPHFDTMHVPRVSRKDILHDIDDSLKNLQVDYVDLYLAYTDSIKKQTDTETIRKMQSLYNYQLREKENQKLKDINAKQEAKVIGLIFILILSITSFLLYSQYTKRKREQKKEQQRRLQEIKERQYQKSIKFIEKNTKHIHFLETQLQVAQSEKDELKQELLEAQKELSYDAWGKLRNPATQAIYTQGSEPDFFLGRGYTGHEHLAVFDLINMNARLYDPALGRFLSPDPYIQMPDFSQNFNRYTYCLNNPLIYTDPNGEIVWFIPVIIGAIIGTYSGGVITNKGQFNPTKWDYNSGKTWGCMFAGAVIGGVSGYVGGAVVGSDIPMANTAGITASSLTNSIGTWAYTDGQTPISVSFGAFSYDFTSGAFGYLVKKVNPYLYQRPYILKQYE